VDDASIAWKVPLGYIESLKARGLGRTGALNLGGSIATASGLVFVGATNDERFRAFDSATGALLWETELEASAHSIPTTFTGKDGRQYVVVAAGGGSFLLSRAGTKIVAFALPDAAHPRAAAPKPTPGPVDRGVHPATAATPRPAAAQNVELPPGDGRQAVLSMCSGCHGLGTSVAQRRTPKQWQTVVETMMTIGAPGSKETAASAVAYLSWRFGRVNVNAAKEEEIVRILEIPPAQAAAIVEFRNHEGQLKSIADLKRVPGIDAAGIAGKQDRIAFSDR